MFNNITFAYPWVLYLLLIIPLLIAWYIFRGMKSQSSVTYSSLQIFKDVPSTLREKIRHIPTSLRLIAIVLLIVALARPQNFSSGENISTEGIDISMVLDISGSMLAEDLKPNRLEAAKNVIDKFIEGRISDRIGLVVFARDAFTQCPLTIDYSVLRNLLLDIKSGMIEDGTAIGNAIANGVNRLKDSDAKSRIIILLTDGVNNSGEVDPVSAAEIAATFGIRVYTIGVGTQGVAPYPVQTPFGVQYQDMPVEIDEGILKEISQMTGGRYFRATDNEKLVQVYSEIDKMEKSKVDVRQYKVREERFLIPAAAAFLLVILEILLRNILLRNLT